MSRAAALPRQGPCVRPAASVGMASPVALAPLAQPSLASMKQAAPAVWQGCPRVLPALAGRFCCPQAARDRRRGDFPLLMRSARAARQLSLRY